MENHKDNILSKNHREMDLKENIIEISIKSSTKEEFIDITAKIGEIIKKSSKDGGICQIFVPHTTAGITINEGADENVSKDILGGFDKIAPVKGNYLHREGNADAHIKATLVGSSCTLFFENNRPLLGTWQSIFFCEFDGPRTRKIWVKTL